MHYHMSLLHNKIFYSVELSKFCSAVAAWTRVADVDDTFENGFCALLWFQFKLDMTDWNQSSISFSLHTNGTGWDDTFTYSESPCFISIQFFPSKDTRADVRLVNGTVIFNVALS